MVNVVCDKAYTTPDLENGTKAFTINVGGKYLKSAKVGLIGDIFGALFGEDFEEGTDFKTTVKNSEAGSTD